MSKVNEKPDAMEERYEFGECKVSSNVQKFDKACGNENDSVQGVLQEEDVHNAWQNK